MSDRITLIGSDLPGSTLGIGPGVNPTKLQVCSIVGVCVCV